MSNVRFRDCEESLSLAPLTTLHTKLPTLMPSGEIPWATALIGRHLSGLTGSGDQVSIAEGLWSKRKRPFLADVDFRRLLDRWLAAPIEIGSLRPVCGQYFPHQWRDIDGTLGGTPRDKTKESIKQR